MDYYSDYIHALATDILADQRRITVLVDADGSEIHLPLEDSDKLGDYLHKLGVKFQKRFIHVFYVIEYPDGFTFTEDDARKMAKELCGV